MITAYKHMRSNIPHHTTVDVALDRIKSNKHKEVIESIRSGKTEKTQLPCIVFAGVIKDDKRTDENVVEHSGFFVLDFDDVDVKMKKMQLSKDSYIYAAWESPSGNGVKALVQCPPNLEKHTQYYNAILSRYPELDTSSKNPSRLCFESHDPDIYINTNSLVWDKTLTDDQYIDWKKNKKDRKKQRALDITSTMIAHTREGKNGNKHDTLLSASNLLGGYVAVGMITEKEAFNHLLTEIKKKNPADINLAKKTIKDGIEHGKNRPLNEAKEIERAVDFTRRSDGSYDFMADDAEMDEYEWAFINGSLEMGLSTGIPKLDQHWLFKKNTLVWIAARDNVGKSYVIWYFAVLAAMFHKWKFLVYSKENSDGHVRKKIKEYYIGKSVKLFDVDDHTKAKQFVTDYFKFMTSKREHTISDFLLKCEIVYDEGYEYDVVVGDPYNAFELPMGDNEYSVNKRNLNKLQTFKSNYSSVWITDHITSTAARTNRSQGDQAVPTKHDVEGGQNKPNKTDDFLIVHRDLKDEARWRVTEIHVDKIKDTETGGKHTPKDEPVEMIFNKNACGYTCNNVDPVQVYWGKGMEVEQETPISQRLNHRWSNEEAPF